MRGQWRRQGSGRLYVRSMQWRPYHQGQPSQLMENPLYDDTIQMFLPMCISTIHRSSADKKSDNSVLRNSTKMFAISLHGAKRVDGARSGSQLLIGCGGRC